MTTTITNNTVATYQTHDNKTLIIEVDEFAENPREDRDNLGTIYSIENYNTVADEEFETEKEMLAAMGDPFVELPVAIGYNGGGETHIRVNNMYGVVNGYIFVTHEKALKEYGPDYQSKYDDVVKCLEGEIEIYEQYLNGDVYSVMVMENNTCPCCEHTKETVLDSLHGIYGFDLAFIADCMGYKAEDLTETYHC